jgi:hypothetical protein
MTYHTLAEMGKYKNNFSTQNEPKLTHNSFTEMCNQDVWIHYVHVLNV